MKLIFSVVTNGQWLQVVVDRISQSITRLKEINTLPLKVIDVPFDALPSFCHSLKLVVLHGPLTLSSLVQASGARWLAHATQSDHEGPLPGFSSEQPHSPYFHQVYYPAQIPNSL